jgi:serine/threonine protein kinase/dipeptidyl aminopeptidase/acylaminoacyl peptidase
MIGLQLDRYRIEAKLGEGGMGVVYKARDTELGRAVALKILPRDKVSDTDRKRRFVQEAKAASALNHAGIVTLYDIGTDAGIDFIVMELLEGATLDQMIPAAGLAPARALRYALEIAEALSKAHLTGIIHRDLKPSNVMVTVEDRIKILDFGLAKLLESPGGEVDATKTAATEHGMVLGTAAYMSPEQAEGRHVDARTDVFSFGAMLYHMVTGRKPFTGDSTLKVLASVLNDDPIPPRQLAPSLPQDLERIIVRCLRKDPARRFQTITDLKLALEDVGPNPSAKLGPVPDRSAIARWIGPAATAAIALAATAAWLNWRPQGTTTDDEPLRAVPLTSLQGAERRPSFSPEGDRVAFSWNGPRQDNSDIYVQQIGTGSELRLTSDPAIDLAPAWSPDGRWIAFLRQQPGDPVRELRLIAPLGGPDRKLSETRLRHEVIRSPSIAWCPDATCLVVTDSVGVDQADALFVVSLESGEKRQLTAPVAPAIVDADPAISPDGKWLVFRRDVAPLTGDLHRIALGAGVTAASQPLRLTSVTLDANSPSWLPESREIVFGGTGGLWRLDAVNAGAPARLAFVGEDGVMPVVSRPQAGRGSRLVYLRTFADLNVWRVNTAGPGMVASSPPAVAISSTRVDGIPALSPDGRRVAFVSGRSGVEELWLADADGANAAQATTTTEGLGFPRWSPDGRQIAFHSNPEGQADIYIIPAGGGKPRNITSHPATDAFPSFSRDGKWLYFSSNRSGPTTIWKQATAGGPAIQVTRNAGTVTDETIDGTDLYYSEAFERPAALWRQPTGGGAPVKVLDGLVNGLFTVIEQGIYYLDRPASETRLQFYDFATRTSKTIAPSLGPTGAGLTASPDGRIVLYTRIDSSIDDLMLVENFR